MTDLTETEDLDIPMGGCLDQVVLVLADHFDLDPLEFWDATMSMPRPAKGSPFHLLAELVAIDLETSTQLPHVREALRRWEVSMMEEANRAMGSPPY